MPSQQHGPRTINGDPLDVQTFDPVGLAVSTACAEEPPRWEPKAASTYRATIEQEMREPKAKAEGRRIIFEFPSDPF